MEFPTQEARRGYTPAIVLPPGGAAPPQVSSTRPSNDRLARQGGGVPIPRVVWVLAAGRFLSAASAFVVLFLMLYLTGPRELPVTVAGLISGSSGAGLLLGNFTGGWFGDRLGHRLVLLSGSTIGAALLIAAPWLPLPLLAVALPVMSYATATAGISEGALSALAVPVGDRRRAVAIGRSAYNAGFAIGPPLGALLLTHSFTTLFVVQGAARLLVLGVTARLLPTEEHPPAAVPATGRGLWRSVLRDRALLVLLPAAVLADLVYRQLFTILPIYLEDQGQPVALYSGLIAAGALLQAVLEVPVVVRLRGRPSYPIIAAGYALTGVGVGLFALQGSGIVVMAIVAILFVTAGEILYKPTAAAQVLDAAPEHLVGQYQGLYAGACTSGTLLAGPVGAAVYSAAPALLWPLDTAVALVAAGLMLALSRTTRTDHPTTRTEAG